MFCKKCGTEQRDGHKYCPKCGTPYIEKDASNEDAIPANIQIDETSNQSIPNDTSSTTPQRDKTYRRFAKVGMWIIIVAIVLTFVRAGFGFSFWWYVYLIIFAIVAMCLGGMTLPDSNDKVKTFDSDDVSVFKIVSSIGAIMLAILYLWGPLNANYHSGDNKSDYSSSFDAKNKNEKPSWLTEWKFVSEIEYGGKIIIKLNDDGSFSMVTLDHTGTPFMRHEGTYFIEGNRVHFVFIKDEKTAETWFEMDNEKHRLYSQSGGVFKQSAF